MNLQQPINIIKTVYGNEMNLIDQNKLNKLLSSYQRLADIFGSTVNSQKVKATYTRVLALPFVPSVKNQELQDLFELLKPYVSKEKTKDFEDIQEELRQIVPDIQQTLAQQRSAAKINFSKEQLKEIAETIYKQSALSDTMQATVGLKGKAATGFVVDTYIQPLISLMEYNEFEKNRLVGAYIQQQLRKSKTEEDLQKYIEEAIGMLSNTFIQSEERKKGVERQAKQIFERTIKRKSPTVSMLDVYDQFLEQFEGTDLSDEQISQLALDMQLATHFARSHTAGIDDIYERLMDERWQLLENYKFSVQSHEDLTKQVEQQFSNIFQVLNKIEQYQKYYKQQLKSSSIFQGADLNYIQTSLQVQRYYNEFQQDLFVLMAADTQKTVDKSNKQVIVQSLLSIIQQQRNVLQKDSNMIEMVRASLYNPIAAQQLDKEIRESFNYENILAELRQYSEQALSEFGFTKPFIASLKQAGTELQSSEQFFQKVNEFQEDIDALQKFIVISAQKQQTQGPEFQSLDQPLKLLSAVSQLSRFINIEKALGGAEQVNTLKNAFAQQHIVNIVQSKSREAYKRTTREIISKAFANIDNELLPEEKFTILSKLFDVSTARAIVDIQSVDELIDKEEYNKILQYKYKQLFRRLKKVGIEIPENIERGSDLGKIFNSVIEQTLASDRLSTKVLNLYLLNEVSKYLVSKGYTSPALNMFALADAYMKQNSEKMNKLQIAIQNRPEFMSNMQSYKILRGMKGGKDTVQKTIQTGTGYSEAQNAGFFGRLHQIKFKNIANEIEQLYPAYIRKFFQSEKEVQENLSELKQKISEDIFELTEEEQTDMQSSELSEQEHTVLMQPGFAVTKPTSAGFGGIFILANKILPEYILEKNNIAQLRYYTSQRMQREVQSELFISADNAIQSLKQQIGEHARLFQRMFYSPTKEFGIPYGTYQNMQGELKYEVLTDLRKTIQNIQIANFNPNVIDYKWTEQFDLQRQLIVNQRGIKDIDYKTYFLLNDVLQGSIISNYIHTMVQNKQSYSLDLVDIIKARLGIVENALIPKMTSEQLQQFSKLFGNFTEQTTETLKELLTNTFGSMRSLLKQISTINSLQSAKWLKNNQYYVFDVLDLANSLVFPKNITYKGIPMQLIPHNLVDPISLQQQNVTGSQISLKPFGYAAQPLMTLLNPVTASTDQIRVINRYLSKNPVVTVAFNESKFDDHSYRMLEYIYDKMKQIQERQRISIRTLDDEIVPEITGTYLPTIILDKQDTEFFRQLGITETTLAGDAYFAQEDLNKFVKLVKRSKSGGFEYEDLPQHVKIMGVARSKGLRTATFKEKLFIKVGSEYLPVMLIMNTQGSRANKTAEFLMGFNRLRKYATGLDMPVPQELKQANNYIKELKEQFEQTTFKLYRMVGDNQFEEIAGLPSVRAILHKTYFYTAMSHEPRFSGKSLLAIQVSTQLEAFQTQMITSVLRQQDRSASINMFAQQKNVAGMSLEAIIGSTLKDSLWKIRGTKQFLAQMKNLQAIYRPIQVYSNPIFTSNRDKLLWLSGVYRKLGIYNKVFLNTAELLEALAQQYSGERTTLRTGTSVISITNKDLLSRMTDLIGKEFGFIQTSYNVFEQFKRFLPASARNRIQSNIYKFGNLLETTKNIKFLKLTVPEILQKSENTMYLALEAETLLNLFQGQQSMLLNIQNKQFFNQAMKFYVDRSLQIASIQQNKITRGLTKKHGLGLYGPHQTARQDIGGINIPKSWLLKLLKSQQMGGYIKEEQVLNLFSKKPDQSFKQQYRELSASRHLFERYALGSIILKQAKDKGIIVQISSTLSKYQSKSDIISFIKFNLPWLTEEQQSNILIRVANDKAHATEYVKRWMHQIRIANEYAQYQSASAIGGISNIDLGNLRHAIFEETALRGGEMWGLLTRHPIAGYMPIVRVAGFSQGENIDVPQHVADAIAGDDDGDKIDLLQFILIDQGIYKRGGARVPEFGVHLPVLAKWKANETQNYMEEIKQFASTQLSRINNMFIP